MFREIRKKKNELSAESAEALLSSERRGVLAVNGDGGYPYAIPVNYLYCAGEGKIYFHGSRAGHKADSLQRSDKVCFTVYGAESVREEPWAPFVRSAVVFGRCRRVEDPERAMELLKRFARKYYPSEELVEREAASPAGSAAAMFEIEIEHISCKEVQEK